MQSTCFENGSTLNRANTHEIFWMDSGPTKMGWLTQQLSHSHRLGVDFEPEGEISPFLRHTPVRLQAVGFLPTARSDVVKGKSSNPENLHKSPSVQKQNSLQLSKQNPWQGSASTGWFLCCPSSNSSSLNLERKAKKLWKAVSILGSLCCPWVLVRFLKHLLVSVLLREQTRLPGQHTLDVVFIFIVPMNTWEEELRKWTLFFKFDVIILCKKERKRKKNPLPVLPTPHYHTSQSVLLWIPSPGGRDDRGRWGGELWRENQEIVCQGIPCLHTPLSQCGRRAFWWSSICTYVAYMFIYNI